MLRIMGHILGVTVDTHRISMVIMVVGRIGEAVLIGVGSIVVITVVHITNLIVVITVAVTVDKNISKIVQKKLDK